MKHLLGVEQLSREEMDRILERAQSFAEVGRRDIKKVPTLRGRTIVNLFYEASTRTLSSFELAAKRLSADVVSVKSAGSSVDKGESLKDTVATLSAFQKMGAKVTLCGPPTLIPRGIEALGCEVSYDLDRLGEADVVYALRMQRERMSESFVPSLREYATRYQIDSRRLGPRLAVRDRSQLREHCIVGTARVACARGPRKQPQR
jgi:aspartate carbamoyltransferase catalytic subunit